MENKGPTGDINPSADGTEWPGNKSVNGNNASSMTSNMVHTVLSPDPPSLLSQKGGATAFNIQKQVADTCQEL